MANGIISPIGTALAGGAIAAALLEALYDKGILNLDESRAVLDKAIKSLTPVMQMEGGMQAARIIGSLQSGKFSARG
jgi:hypothetical protein